jgi:hypothetical protein
MEGRGTGRILKCFVFGSTGGRDFKVTFKNKGIYYLSLNLKRHSLPSKSLHFGGELLLAYEGFCSPTLPFPPKEWTEVTKLLKFKIIPPLLSNPTDP